MAQIRIRIEIFVKNYSNNSNIRYNTDLHLAPVSVHQHLPAGAEDPDGEARTREGMSVHQLTGQSQLTAELSHLVLVEVLQWLYNLHSRY